jgi:pyridoxal phosphate enzyme (YggS family)
MATGVAANVAEIRRRIEAAARRAGRDPATVTLVGVTKTMPPDRIREAIDAGLLDLGENRVQEAREKMPLLSTAVRWHLVGHLQANKANLAARLFGVIHSIDSADLLQRVDRAAARDGRTIDALVQVDLAGEATKTGVAEPGLDEVLRSAAECRQVTVRGLMILPPYDPDPGKSRAWFRRLREIRDAARSRHPGLRLDDLSMGMTEDFEIAIEEGATLVRVGRALFGERNRPA